MNAYPVSAPTPSHDLPASPIVPSSPPQHHEQFTVRAHPHTRPPPHLAPDSAPSHQKPFKILTSNIQDLRSHQVDLADAISCHHPDVLFLQETHLYSHQQKSLPLTNKILKGYDLYFSSIPTPRYLSFASPDLRAPGGVILAIRSTLASHPDTTAPGIPRALAGYCTHLRLPMAAGHTLHLINVYWPPQRTDIHQASQAYLRSLMQPADPTHHFIVAGDLNTNMLSPPAPFSDFLATCSLIPLNASRDAHLTHFPNRSIDRPSALDDILVSSSLPLFTSHTMSDIACTVIPHMQHSDHSPLSFTCPRALLPILPRPTPVPRADAHHDAPHDAHPTYSIIQPIPLPALESTRSCIASDLGPLCDTLETVTQAALALVSATIPHDETFNPTVPWAECHALLAKVHIDIDALATMHTDMLQSALHTMALHCPSRTHQPRPQHAPLHTTRPHQRQRFLPISMQRKLSPALLERRILTFSKSQVQQWLHFGLPLHDSSPRLTFNGSAIAYELTAALSSTANLHSCHSVGPRMRSRYTLGTVPIQLITTMPTSDDPSLWRNWLLSCSDRICALRKDIRKFVKPIGDAATWRRRIATLFRRSQRKANRLIFAAEGVNPKPNSIDKPTSPNLTSIWDPVKKEHIMDSDAMIAYAHNYFSKAWSAPTDAPTTVAPFPWEPSANNPSPIDPFVLRTPAAQATITALPYVLRQHTFSSVLSKLRNNKSPGLDGVPNELIRIMPDSFKASLRLLFILMWITGRTPDAWKTSVTTLLHKKDDPTDLKNKRPIGMHITIYKLWTRFVTMVASEFSEDHSILSPTQEGFRPGHGTARQLQRLVQLIEDAARSNNDLYLLYVDFTSAFNTIDHACLFHIMAALGYPSDLIAVVQNIYKNATTRVAINRTLGHFTDPITVGRGTIQGDTLSPLIFLIYLEPLMRWLQAGGHGYSPGCTATPPTPTASESCPNPPQSPDNTTAALAYADDLGILESCYLRLLHQFHKLKQYCTWGRLSLNAGKCAVTGILHSLTSSSTTLSITAQTDILRRQLGQAFQVGFDTIPFLPPDQPYKYLGVWLTLTLNFKFHLDHLYEVILEKGMQLISASVPPRQCLTIIQNVLKPKITYCFPIAPFSRTDVATLDNLLIKIARHSMQLSQNISNITVLSPTARGGIGLLSLMADYAAVATQTLTQALHDKGDLGRLTCCSLARQLTDYGQLSAPMAHRDKAFSRHPMALRLLSLANDAKILLHTAQLKVDLKEKSQTPALLHLTGNPMWTSLTIAIHLMTHAETLTPEPDHLRPLWRLGLSSFEPLAVTIAGQPHIIDTDILLRAFQSQVSTRTMTKARLALNKLTLFLHGEPTWDTCTSVKPLPLTLRSVMLPHAFASIPQPTLSTINTTSSLVPSPGPQPPAYPQAAQTPHPTPPHPTPDLPFIGPPTRAQMSNLIVKPRAHTLDPPPAPPPNKRTHVEPSPPLPNPPNDLNDPPPPANEPAGPPNKALLSCLFDKFVHVITTPAHPDFDILPTKGFTIQVGLRQLQDTPLDTQTAQPEGSAPQETRRTRAFVYRPNGTCVGSISRERLVWLHTCYHHCKQADPEMHRRFSTGSFASDLASTLTHYHCTQKSTAKPPHPNANWSLPPPHYSPC